MVLATAEVQVRGTMEQYRNLSDRVRAAQAGDMEPLAGLFEEFDRTVYAIAKRRLGNPEKAADVKQEVFKHVTARLGQLRDPERFAGWLRQVATRMAINFATRVERRQHASIEAIAEPHIGAADDGIDGRERARLLREFVGKLKPLDRQSLTMFYFEHRPLIEIAELLDTPIGTVKRRIHTARRRLREAILGASNAQREVLTSA